MYTLRMSIVLPAISKSLPRTIPTPELCGVIVTPTVKKASTSWGAFSYITSTQ